MPPGHASGMESKRGGASSLSDVREKRTQPAWNRMLKSTTTTIVARCPFTAPADKSNNSTGADHDSPIVRHYCSNPVVCRGLEDLTSVFRSRPGRPSPSAPGQIRTRRRGLRHRPGLHLRPRARAEKAQRQDPVQDCQAAREIDRTAVDGKCRRKVDEEIRGPSVVHLNALCGRRLPRREVQVHYHP